MKPARLLIAVTIVALGLAAALPAAAAAGHTFPIDGPHRYGSPYGEDRGTHYHRGQGPPGGRGHAPTSTDRRPRGVSPVPGRRRGALVVIHGDDGRDSVFMHMQAAAYVAPNQRVEAGQLVGRVGSTGHSTGPHLHFERWAAHWYAGGHDYNPLSALLSWDRPESPKSLVAGRTSGGVALDWAPVRESDLAGYRVYRRTVDGS